MWWILQIIAVLGVAALHAFNRWNGCANIIDLKVQWLINLLVQAGIAPAFMKSYALAPSIFQPWFLGTGLIALLGFITSLFIFGEALTAVKITGAALSLIGAVLLIV